MSSPSTTSFNWPMLKRLWGEWVWPYKRLIFINFLLIIGVSISTAAYPKLIEWAISAFQNKDFQHLIYLPAMIIAITATKGLTLYGHVALTNRIASSVVRDLQNAVFKALNRADYLTLTREAPAALAQRFYAEMNYIQTAVSRIITSLVRDTLMIAGLVGVMIYIDWQLAAASLLVLPFAALPVAEVGKRLRKNALEAQGKIGSMTSFLTESFSGARLIRTYQIEPYMNAQGEHVFENIHQLRLRAANLFARVEPILEVLGGLSVAVVIVLIGWRISSGQSSLGQFAGFISALLIAAQPMRTLGNINAILQEGLAAAERVFALIDMTPKITASIEAPTLQLTEGAISFEEVSFTFDDGTRALQEISIALPGRKKIALVGRSGSGKSTFFNLLPRLYDTTSGSISIDGQKIKNVSLTSLRNCFALVAQDSIMVQDTVHNNIALGLPNLTREEVISAAKDAAAHDFITKLSNGYDTLLGEGGIQLSGGEKQRIALARALLRNAPILLLDEPTSALDADSEHLVQKAIARLTENKTTFIIAHRLSTIRSADLILVLENGRIVESGTHSELLTKKGAYANLHAKQFSDDSITPGA